MMKAKSHPLAFLISAARRARVRRVTAFKSNRLCAGQAAIEYVLLVSVMTLIFGALFTGIRHSLYKVWVCEIGPRVEAPAGCTGDTKNCWASIKKTAGVSANVPPPNCEP